ncbi:MAG: hypothetical protein JNN01_26790, partial [Opitutaceae bacterium]|nr:hypothetical protein [Opitutaceae bacterium]
HSTLLADRIDYQRGVVRLFARRNNGGVQSYTAGGDLNGNYRIWKRDFRTSLGFTAWNSRRNPYDHFANPDFGEQNAHIGTPVRSSATALGFDRIEIPLNNVRAAMDRLINIPSEQYRIPPTAQIGTLVDTTESNVYLQQNIEVIPNRLIITGAVSKIYNQANSENYTAVPPTTFTNTVQENRNNRNLHRFGLVLNVTKNIALYGVETTNVVFINSSSRTADGSFIPPRDGQMREAGVKASLFDDRVSLTAAIYNTYYTNWAVSRTGAVIPEYGFNVFDLIRDSYIKGWDFSLAMRPVRDWQVMFNLTEQDPRVQATNSPLPSSNRGSWSVFTSYKLKGDVLGKFRVGGGANRFRKRLTGASQLVLPSGQAGSSLLPGGQYYLKDGTMTTAFVEFNATRRLSLRLNVNNVFDEVMVVGAQHWAAIDPSQPRTFSVIVTYRY